MSTNGYNWPTQITLLIRKRKVNELEATFKAAKPKGSVLSKLITPKELSDKFTGS